MSTTDGQRVNAGYTITDTIHIGATEFVLGEHTIAPSRYVTWECRNGSNYYWGHYMSDRLDAVKDLLDRAGIPDEPKNESKRKPTEKTG